MAAPISSLAKSPICPHHFARLPQATFISSSRSLKPFIKGHENATLTAKVQSFGFSGSFFDEGLGSDGEPPSVDGGGIGLEEEKEEIPCPPGLRKYETMAVMRPDMTEDERFAATQKYEELLIAGGGMYVEIFNRGVLPLAYSIKKKNREGETNIYLDGIYLLFTYFTKPESMLILEETLLTDDNVIRFTSFKVRKRKF